MILPSNTCALEGKNGSTPSPYEQEMENNLHFDLHFFDELRVCKHPMPAIEPNRRCFFHMHTRHCARNNKLPNKLKQCVK